MISNNNNVQPSTVIKDEKQIYIVLRTKFASSLDKFFRKFPELDRRNKNLHIIDLSRTPDPWKDNYSYTLATVDQIASTPPQNQKEEVEEETPSHTVVLARERHKQHMEQIADFPREIVNSKKQVYIIQDEKLDNNPSPITTEDAEAMGIYRTLSSMPGRPDALGFLYLNQNQNEKSKIPRSINTSLHQPHNDKNHWTRANRKSSGDTSNFYTLMPDSQSFARVNLSDGDDGLDKLNLYTRMLIAETGNFDGFKFKDLQTRQKNNFKQNALEQILHYKNAEVKIKASIMFSKGVKVRQIAKKLETDLKLTYLFLCHQAFADHQSASSIGLEKLKTASSKQTFKELSPEKRNRFDTEHQENTDTYQDSLLKVRAMTLYSQDQMSISKIAKALNCGTHSVRNFLKYQANGDFESAANCRLEKEDKLGEEEVYAMIEYIIDTGLRLPPVFLRDHFNKLAYDLYGINMNDKDLQKFFAEHEDKFKRLIELSKANNKEPEEITWLKKKIRKISSNRTTFHTFTRMLPYSTELAYKTPSYRPADIKCKQNTKTDYIVGRNLHAWIFGMLDEKNSEENCKIALKLILGNKNHRVEQDNAALKRAMDSLFLEKQYTVSEAKSILYTAFKQNEFSALGRKVRNPARFDLLLRHLLRSSKLKLSPKLDENQTKLSEHNYAQYQDKSDSEKLDDEWENLNKIAYIESLKKVVGDDKVPDLDEETNETEDNSDNDSLDNDLKIEEMVENALQLSKKSRLGLSSSLIILIHNDAQNLSEKKSLSADKLDEIIIKYGSKGRTFAKEIDLLKFAKSLDLELVDTERRIQSRARVLKIKKKKAKAKETRKGASSNIFTNKNGKATKTKRKTTKVSSKMAKFLRMIAPQVKKGNFTFSDLRKLMKDEGKVAAEDEDAYVLKLYEVFGLKYGIKFCEKLSSGNVKSSFEKGSIADRICADIILEETSKESE